jgi:hypothetical protein
VMMRPRWALTKLKLWLLRILPRVRLELASEDAKADEEVG